VTAEGTNRPLVGTQVLVVGSSLGAQTNDAGEYRIANVPAGTRSVRAQRIGYAPSTQTVTVTAGEAATVDFTIREAPVALDQVVVTATGDVRKKELTNSVSTISMEALQTAPVTNTQQLITAQAPGITVLGNSGQPGAGGRIMLRGVNSISQGNNPVIYVDGVRIFSGSTPIAGMARQNTNPFNDIKPEDIERVEIVKGASATTLYGTEASSGVIQIFTRRGRMGTPRWNAEATAGRNDLDQMGPDGDPTGLFVKECRGPGLFGLNITPTSPQFGQDVPFEDPTCPASGSWLRKGLVQRYSASVAGGSDVARYFLSGNYGNEEGAIAPNELMEGGLRGNFSFHPVQSLDVALNSSYQRSRNHWIPDGNLAQGFMLNVGRGYSNNYKSPPTACSATAQFCLANGEVLRQAPITRGDHYITGLTVNHTPNETLSNRLSVGYDYTTQENREIVPFGQLNTPAGRIRQEDWTRRFVSVDYAGTLRNKFRGDVFQSSLSWGGQLFQDDLKSMTVSGTVFSGPGEPLVSTSARPLFGDDNRRRVINAGLFLQEQVAWNDRLFVTAGVRVDGNSAFGENFGLQTYPKLGVAYVLSDHDFFPSSWWETLKLRGALGESGKAPGAFDAVRTWDPTSGDDGKPAVIPNQIGNPDLGPERTRELELGLESSLWAGRLAVDFNYFDTRTLDALIQVRYPPSQGFLSTQLENVGELRNRGVEARVEGSVIRREAVEWRGRVNYTRMSNEAVDLGDVREISIGTNTVVRQGYPVPAIFGRKILNPDAVAAPIVTDTAVHLGRTFPNEIIGLGSSLTLWRRLTLDGLGEFQHGGMNINFIGYQNTIRGVWRGCYDVQRKLVAAQKGDANALAGVTARDRARCAFDAAVRNSDFWVEPMDFFRLRYVSATYDIPARFLRGAQAASLTLAGRNLFMSTDYSGLDPESADQSDNTFARREYYQLPSLRSFTLSLKATF
jgi:TonB-dependent starch-binding outer membrane protein SusC